MMKFKFKIQQYQTDAVNSVVDVFSGQPYVTHARYTRDLGVRKLYSQVNMPLQFSNMVAEGKSVLQDSGEYIEDDLGFRNERVHLSSEQLLENIREIQMRNNIKLSDKLIDDLGVCSLDVEMETGTGKTYVYIKTIFELNKRYGWSKFIVVVPSIAIREGVKKSFEITEEHFMEHYGKKARYFVYNSSNLYQLDSFSSSADINVMIINIQAFNTSMKEGGRTKEARKIYEKCDEFSSRRPIDVIKANRPILILDEPQKMGGKATQAALKNFNPLFSINYSATHAKQHNLVYVLDALDAYNKKLVKKIEVKGFEIRNLRGTDRYIFVESIIISPKKPPMARIEIEVNNQNSITRKIYTLGVEANLYELSAGRNMPPLEAYKGYIISEIDPIRGTVTFANGEVIRAGDVVGDVSELDMRRIQIRETIISHFEKEEELFNMGIKTLSLFFIDEVAKYRQYDEDGNEVLGEYGKIFEEEYLYVLNQYISLVDTPYQKYLKSINVSDTHKGYFSIDKRTGRAVDSVVKRGSSESDDISAYELILKNKERLLSFDEPTRFIFSHSALREGWDNPNVFQICTLKHSDSTTTKRQEVGRGLRLCVNQYGSRMDLDACGDRVHQINKLTVIASESYKTFVGDLQKQIKEVLYDRPTKATLDYFEGKTVMAGANQIVIDEKHAKSIYRYLLKNDYIDDDDNITELYHADLINNVLKPLPDDLKPYSEGIHMLIQSIFDESVLDDMFEDGHSTKVNNELNENFYKEEFQTLWNYINHKYTYRVEFDSNELIRKAIAHINNNLYVTRKTIQKTTGEQRDKLNEYDFDKETAFERTKMETEQMDVVSQSQAKYDVIGKIAETTVLTRKTVAAILKGIEPQKMDMFGVNPEEFIAKTSKLIKEQKATMIVEYIKYDTIEGKYDAEIFTAGSQNFDRAIKVKKHIQDYVFLDGISEDSVEKRFAQDLDVAEEVCVYAKLPKGFSIPTPVGNYTPDWAIAFNKGTVKHIFFIAETKGTMETLQFREIEKAKIMCARKLFNELSTSKVKYHDVSSYQELLNIMGQL